MAKIEESGLSPSFNCYTCDSSTSTAVAKVIHEEQDAEFEFSFSSTEDEVFVKEFFDQHEELSSCSSLEEVDDLENLPSGPYCVWRPKANGGSAKCKKSSSTGGSGRSKRWIGIRYLLRRSNSDGKDPMALLTPKQKRVSGEPKGKKGVHEQFYVQRRHENEVVKRKTYLPYRQDLVGLFATSKGMLPF